MLVVVLVVVVVVVAVVPEGMRTVAWKCGASCFDMSCFRSAQITWSLILMKRVSF